MARCRIVNDSVVDSGWGAVDAAPRASLDRKDAPIDEANFSGISVGSNDHFLIDKTPRSWLTVKQEGVRP